jgi:HSP20 family protein
MQRMPMRRAWGLWDPWSDLYRWRDELARTFPSTLTEEREYPAMNVTRLPDRVIVEALVPGLDRENLDITAVGNTLTIRGERKPESGIDAEAYHRHERDVGRFVRTVKLDERVTTDNVSATYRDGILRIELPYAPEAKPHKVSVQG